MANTSDSFHLNRLPEWMIEKPYAISDFIDDWTHNNNNNREDIVRLLFFLQICETIETEKLDGYIAELGVFRGNSAKLFSRLLPNRKIYLFDTFEGFDKRDTDVEGEGASAGGFSTTSIEQVKSFIGPNDYVKFCQGYFPETATVVEDGDKFCLVHLDADLYQPILSGLQFFYDRVVRGGFILVHDYHNPCWPGSKKAVDEFLADKSEDLVPIPDKSGTVLIRKN